MDIYAYLRRDHRAVSHLFKEIIDSKSPSQREAIYEDLKHELMLHSDAEDASFYKTLNQYSSLKECIEHAKEEHSEIKKAMRKLDRLSSRTNHWLVQLGEFKNIVEHHVHEEEENIFEKAKEVLSHERAKELALEMDALKGKKANNKKPLSFGQRVISQIF